MQEDKRLKRFLVLQSFCPLFVLIFIQHAGYGYLVFRFFSRLFSGDWTVIECALQSTFLGDVVVTVLCVAWFLITAIVAVGFRNLQKCNFVHHGEMISIGSEKKDSGVTFLVSFVLPLLVDEVSSLRGFIFFIVLL